MGPKDPLVSVIVVNRNGREFLEECFNSLENLSYSNYEILFVDNASTDGSMAFIKQNYLRTRTIRNTKNLGFCIANNNAAHIAKGKYLFFLNNDTKVDPEVLSRLVEKMEEDPSVGICCCKIMSYDGKTHFHTGIGIDTYGYPRVGEEIFYAEGSSLIIRKVLFRRLDGFDPKYFIFHEDIDLTWRAWLMNYQVIPIPKAIVYHMCGGYTGGAIVQGSYVSTLFRRYLSERNNIRTILKNYSPKTLARVLPRYILINLGETFLFLVTLQIKVVLCYLKAYYWNVINLKDTLERRREIQRTRQISDRELMKRMYRGSGKFLILRKIGIPRFK